MNIVQNEHEKENNKDDRVHGSGALGHDTVKTMADKELVRHCQFYPTACIKGEGIGDEREYK